MHAPMTPLNLLMCQLFRVVLLFRGTGIAVTAHLTATARTHLMFTQLRALLMQRLLLHQAVVAEIPLPGRLMCIPHQIQTFCTHRYASTASASFMMLHLLPETALSHGTGISV